MGDIRLGENMRAGNTARIGAMRCGGTRVGAAHTDIIAGLTANTALSAFQIQTWDFDGSTYINRPTILTGLADSQVGTVSLWFRSDAASGSLQNLILIETATNMRFQVRMDASGEISILTGNSDDGVSLTLISSAQYENDSTWHHLMSSWNQATGVSNLYIDGVSALAASPQNPVETADLDASTNLTVGAARAGGNTWEGQLGQIYVNLAAIIDLTTAANRLLFYSANSGPVELGAAGATPTGTAPILFMDDNENIILHNRGTGGNFNTETGTVVDNGLHPTRATPATEGNQYLWSQQHMGGVKRLDDTLNDTQWTVVTGAP